MKTLEDERYVVIKAYKCTVSEILRFFFCIGMYCVYRAAAAAHSITMASFVTPFSRLYACAIT